MVGGGGAEQLALVRERLGEKGVEGGLHGGDGSQFSRPLPTPLQLQHNCIFIQTFNNLLKLYVHIKQEMFWRKKFTILKCVLLIGS